MPREHQMNDDLTSPYCKLWAGPVPPGVRYYRSPSRGRRLRSRDSNNYYSPSRGRRSCSRGDRGAHNPSREYVWDPQAGSSHYDPPRGHRPRDGDLVPEEAYISHESHCQAPDGILYYYRLIWHPAVDGKIVTYFQLFRNINNIYHLYYMNELSITCNSKIAKEEINTFGIEEYRSFISSLEDTIKMIITHANGKKQSDWPLLMMYTLLCIQYLMMKDIWKKDSNHNHECVKGLTYAVSKYVEGINHVTCTFKSKYANARHPQELRQKWLKDIEAGFGFLFTAFDTACCILRDTGQGGRSNTNVPLCYTNREYIFTVPYEKQFPYNQATMCFRDNWIIIEYADVGE